MEGAIFGGAGDDAIATEVTFDPKWVTKNDNTKYNKDLAAFATVICDDVCHIRYQVKMNQDKEGEN